MGWYSSCIGDRSLPYRKKVGYELQWMFLQGYVDGCRGHVRRREIPGGDESDSLLHGRDDLCPGKPGDRRSRIRAGLRSGRAIADARVQALPEVERPADPAGG